MVCKRLLVTNQLVIFPKLVDCNCKLAVAISHRTQRSHLNKTASDSPPSFAGFRLLTGSIPSFNTLNYALGPELLTQWKNRREEDNNGAACAMKQRWKGMIFSVQSELGHLQWHSAEGCCDLCWTEADKNTDSPWGQLEAKQALTEMAWSFVSNSGYGEVLPWHSGWHCFGKGNVLHNHLVCSYKKVSLHYICLSPLANFFKLRPIHWLQDSPFTGHGTELQLNMYKILWLRIQR